MDSKQFKEEVQTIAGYMFKNILFACSKHGEQVCGVRKHESEVNWTEGYCSLCEQERLEEEKLHEKQKEEARLKKEAFEKTNNEVARLLKCSAIPPRFQDRTFASYAATNEKAKRVKEACQHYASNFEDALKTGASIILCGKTGTGKSHLACAIANQIISEQQKSALFVKVIKAIRSVKETYKGGSEQEAINLYTKPDLLILEEIGVQFGSDTEKQIMFEILNERYENYKPTILTSNLTAIELKEFIGDRIIDRMKEGGGIVFICDWESYRANN